MICRDLVNKQERVVLIGEINANILCVNSLRETEIIGLLSRIDDVGRGIKSRNLGIILAVVRCHYRNVSRKTDTVIHNAQTADLDFRNSVFGIGNIKFDRNTSAAVPRNKGIGIEYVNRLTVGELVGVGINVGVVGDTAELVGSAAEYVLCKIVAVYINRKIRLNLFNIGVGHKL